MNEVKRYKIGQVLERFMSYIEFKDSHWFFKTNHKSGYGYFSLNYKKIRAHKFSYEIFKGPVGDNLVLHTCDIKNCVNPDHLYLGTDKENAIDRIKRNRDFNKKKTKCPKGHEYSKENTRLRNGRRNCRKCDSSRAKNNYSKKQTALLEKIAGVLK